MGTVTLKGLVMDNKEKSGYNNAGLFCELQGATVEDLVFDSSCSFSGQSAGVLAVNVTGFLTVKNVKNQANVNGNTKVGGFISFVSGLQQGDFLLFENCSNEGYVTTGGWDVGGFIGLINGNTNAIIEFVNCRNIESINGAVSVGGFVGAFWVNPASMVRVNNSTNDGNVNAEGADGRCGGLIGYYEQNYHLIITNFVNNGNVSGANRVGGLVGAVYTCNNAQFIIESSLNLGTVSGTRFAGGFIGYNMDHKLLNLTIVNSTNNGTVYSSGGCSGGFAGGISRNTQMTLNIVNSTNNGIVDNSLNTVGGFIGIFYNNHNSSFTFSADVNHGLVQTRGNQAFGFTGGFVGYMHENDVHLVFKECDNTAFVTGSSRVGGFFGEVFNNMYIDMLLERCFNSGTINGTERLGGFSGLFNNNQNLTIASNGCFNNGRVSGSSYVAGFIGDVLSASQYWASVSLLNFQNNGTIQGTEEVQCGIFCVDCENYQGVTTTIRTASTRAV